MAGAAGGPEAAREFVKRWPIYARDVDNPLWMDPQELRGLQESNLRRQLEWVAAYSPYYREAFKRDKVAPEKIRALGDLERIPVTSRQTYLENPLAFLLVVDPPEALDATHEINYTSGTSTGSPAPFFNSTYDMFNISLQLRRAAEISGLTPDDTLLNLFPYGSLPHFSFYRAIHLASTVGMKMVNALAGKDVGGFKVHRDTDEIIGLAAKQEATALMGTARFERRLILRAEQLGADLSTIRAILALGEPVPEAMRDEMRAHLQAMGAGEVFINNGYGFTECQGSFVECCEFGGNHNPAPNLYHIEILDPGTLKPLPDGELGLLAITHIDRRGTVLLRYIVGDLAAQEWGVCPHCGRSGARLLVSTGSSYAVRSEDVLRVDGRAINTESVKNQLASIKGLVEYQLVVEKEDPENRFSPDRVIIRLSVAGRMREDVEREVMERIRQAAGVTPKVEFVQSPDIYDPSTGLKATRFLDRR
jgi:phenylacetate-coenzyme A ligase PaaK-like adenylate-forming protein